MKSSIRDSAKRLIANRYLAYARRLLVKERVNSQELAFYRDFVQPGDLCFDVGAHVGKRTAVFLALGARVVCVEPQPHCIEILRRKYQHHKQVTIVPAGLAAAPGTLSLTTNDSADTIATFSEKWKTGRFQSYKWGMTIQVPVTTLDSLIGTYGRPKFCKIDVEGFEYQVLQGLSSPIPMLSFEFTKEFLDDTTLCINRIKQLGNATFNYVFAEQFTLVSSDWLDGGAALQELGQIDDDRLWGDIYARVC